MALINQATFEKSSSRLAECPQTEWNEYAFIGRSNVGKSSLINFLTGRKNLAKTSGKPGKTRLINHFRIDDRWYLVDLPGYGWAQVSKKEKEAWKKMIEEYLLKRENLISVFVLVDSRHAPQKIDLDFMRWLGEKQIPFAIVFTKTDKQGRPQTDAKIASYKKILLKDWEELPPLFKTSTVAKQGEDLLAYILQLNEQC